ncbi:MAG: hypothetical protein IJ154_09410 [Bacteroidales bacterium]|nr:hypothetical protein [Bacteroidales bacterium]
MDQTTTLDNDASMDVKKEAVSGPKESTLEFLRIFARLYTPDNAGTLVLPQLN